MRSDRDSCRCRPGSRVSGGLRVPIRNPQSAFRNAFTLVELMVVIAIIAILAGLLMPAVRSALNKSHESRTLNLIHQCQIAATGYFNDHGDYPPSTWQDLFLTTHSRRSDGGTDVLDLDGNGVVDINDYINPSLALGPVSADAGPITRALRSSWPAWPLRTAAPICSPPTELGSYVDSTASPCRRHATADTNWYFDSTNRTCSELVDWWGNPLIYIHNRDYAVTGMA